MRSFISCIAILSAFPSFCTGLMPSSPGQNKVAPRRAFFQSAFAAATTTVLLPTQSAFAGLLDDYGSDPSKIVTKPKETEVPTGKATKVDVDPTLRASYYYPTAKKRYIPRIIKVSQEIQLVPDYLESANWDMVLEFQKTAENAILPLQLYQSSLDGQGLSMSSSYAKIMKDDALQYEKSYKVFAKACKDKNALVALTAVSDMGVAVDEYRLQGRLSDDSGNIPSVDDIKRMSMRRPTMDFTKKK